MEDKIVQRAMIEVLNAIYEVDFLGFSYGFRPQRRQHDALDALAAGIVKKKVNWILDADISDFFTTIDHQWLMKFLAHRIADKRVLRLCQKWLNAGIMEKGVRTDSREGTAQGAPISPLLANIYLHYILDLWVQQWRKRHASGDLIIVRYGDDFVVGFEHRKDAEKFYRDLQDRVSKFTLKLQTEKTRLIEFGRFAAQNRKKRGLRRPENFDFLGFTHICATRRKGGGFRLKRSTIKKRMRTKLKETKISLMQHRHLPIPVQGQYLASVVRGHLAYYAVPGNLEQVAAFRTQVTRHWHRALKRRSQRCRLNWVRMNRLATKWLPPARIMHPWPDRRFDFKHSRQEPSALAAHAGICAGGHR